MSTLFAGTFPAGFESAAAAALPALLPGASVERTESGLVFFRAPKADPARLPIFHSVFLVLRRFPARGITFSKMAQQVKSCRLSQIGEHTGTFRVRWSQENRFAAVPGNVASETERAIAKATGLVPDRSLPDFEFWFAIRRESGFFGFLLPKEAARVPEKGELRPELAHLALHFAGMKKHAVFCDPFAGHGALPRAALESFSPEKVYLSDADPALVEWLRAQPVFSPPTLPVPADARRLSHIPSGTVDFLVTDPPWGLFREEGDLPGLYRDFLAEAARILRPLGVLCILTAKKEDFSALLAENASFSQEAAADILVNGKKARIFRAVRKDTSHG